MKRTVLFLGSGASVPFGYPTTNEILDRIAKSLNPPASFRKKRPVWSKWVDRYEDEIRGELRAVLRAVLPGFKHHARKRGASIIDVLSTVDFHIANSLPLSSNFGLERLKRARHFLNLAMNGVLQGDLMKSYRARVARWIWKSSRKGSRVSIVTTNYDCVFELQLFAAISKRGKVFKDVDFGTSVSSPSSVDFLRPKKSKLGVFKLHGSLNWLRCSRCQRLYVNPQKRIASLEFWKETRPYNTCLCRGRLRGVMVAPSYVRDMRDSHFTEIWDAALQELRAATEWIFIGYSLPQEDVGIRSLLLRALHSRKRLPKMQLALWDEHETAMRLQVKNEIPLDGKLVPLDALRRYLAFTPKPCFAGGKDYFPEGAISILDVLIDARRGDG